MYFVKYGNEYIHDPRVGLILPSATLETEVNKSDNFSFEIPITHELCNSIKERDRDNLVTVLSDDKIIFRGEITSVKQNFHLTKTVQCRGELAYLNDSIVRPYSTLEGESSRTAPSTVNGYFQFLIEEHNSQVEERKQFVIGDNLGSSLVTDNYIYVNDSSYPTVGTTLKDKILDDLGGYIDLEYLSDGTRRISLLDNFQKTNAQVIDFGVNLLDFVNDVDALDVATFIIPLGGSLNDLSEASSSSTSLNLTVSSDVLTTLQNNVNYELGVLNEAKEYLEGLDPDATEEQRQNAQESVDEAQTDYDIAVAKYDDAVIYTTNGALGGGYHKYNDMIYSAESVQKYGWIGKTSNYSDSEYVSDLIIYGINDLKTMIEPNTTIEIKAIDLSMIKPDYDPIMVRQYIRVRSKPHNYDSYMLCSKITYDLVKPENNTFTLGTMYQTFTGQANKKINSLNSTINSTVEATSKIGSEFSSGVKSIGELKVSSENTSKKVNTVDSKVTEMDTRVTQVEETSKQVEATTDYIVQNGVDANGWTYRKMASGVSECWGEIRCDWTSEGIFGEMYYKTVVSNLPADLFVSSVRVTGSVVSTNYGLFAISFFANDQDKVSYYVYSPANDAKTVWVQLHVVGRWK